MEEKKSFLKAIGVRLDLGDPQSQEYNTNYYKLKRQAEKLEKEYKPEEAEKHFLNYCIKNGFLKKKKFRLLDMVLTIAGAIILFADYVYLLCV